MEDIDCPKRYCSNEYAETDCSIAMLQVSADTMKQLQTRKATVTPSWWALLIMFKYRSRQNFKQADFLGEQQTQITVLDLSLLVLGLFAQIKEASTTMPSS